MKPMNPKAEQPETLSRRRLLLRIGMVAGAAYAVPAMVGFNAAHASGNSGNSGASRGGRSGPSRAGRSAPSRGGNSRPSRGGRGRSSGVSRGRRRGTADEPVWLRRMFGG